MKKIGEKSKFTILLIAFITSAFIAPCIYFIIRLNLFTQTTKLQVGFWGFVVFGIIIAGLNVLARIYLDGLKTKWTYAKQLVSGGVRLILPLVLVLLVITWLRDNLDIIVEALYVIIPLETFAIIINPIPKWSFDNNVEGLEQIADRVFKRNSENKE